MNNDKNEDSPTPIPSLARPDHILQVASQSIPDDVTITL